MHGGDYCLLLEGVKSDIDLFPLAKLQQKPREFQKENIITQRKEKVVLVKDRERDVVTAKEGASVSSRPAAAAAQGLIIITTNISLALLSRPVHHHSSRGFHCPFVFHAKLCKNPFISFIHFH